MIRTKSKRLHAPTANSPPQKFSTTSPVFDGFRPILESDLRSVLTSINLKSCELDLLPRFVIMDYCYRWHCSFFTLHFNRSLAEGYIPASQKRFFVLKSLKKPNLDPTSCQNFRPISNLSFIYKTRQHLVSLQLRPYLQSSGLLPTHQFDFRAKYSTETALLSLLLDIYSAPWNLIWNKIPSFTLVKILLVWSYPNKSLEWVQDLLDSYHVRCPSRLCLRSISVYPIHCGHSYSFS